MSVQPTGASHVLIVRAQSLGAVQLRSVNYLSCLCLLVSAANSAMRLVVLSLDRMVPTLLSRCVLAVRHPSQTTLNECSLRSATDT